MRIDQMNNASLRHDREKLRRNSKANNKCETKHVFLSSQPCASLQRLCHLLPHRRPCLAILLFPCHCCWFVSNAQLDVVPVPLIPSFAIAIAADYCLCLNINYVWCSYLVTRLPHIHTRTHTHKLFVVSSFSFMAPNFFTFFSGFRSLIIVYRTILDKKNLLHSPSMCTPFNLCSHSRLHFCIRVYAQQPPPPPTKTVDTFTHKIRSTTFIL